MNIAADPVDPIMEMNTTPLIDVMLVLLVMFIITIPIQTHAVKVDMPTMGDPTPNPVKNKIVIDVRGAVLWNGRPISLVSLARTLEKTKTFAVTPELHLEPVPLAPYARVDEVLAVTKKAEIENLGFVGNERYRNF